MTIPFFSLGPSHRWGEVYKFLPTTILRPWRSISPVGVAGLLLAGGINFYGNQKGFSADNVIQYEVVLADSSIVYTTKTSYSDSFGLSREEAPILASWLALISRRFHQPKSSLASTLSAMINPHSSP